MARPFRPEFRVPPRRPGDPICFSVHYSPFVFLSHSHSHSLSLFLSFSFFCRAISTRASTCAFSRRSFVLFFFLFYISIHAAVDNGVIRCNAAKFRPSLREEKTPGLSSRRQAGAPSVHDGTNARAMRQCLPVLGRFLLDCRISTFIIHRYIIYPI